MSTRIVSGMIMTLLFIGMLTLAFNIQSVKSEPKTWTVDDDGPADFHTIQEAINAASPGDNIFVHNGTYQESLAINTSNLMLFGENRDMTIIQGGICIENNKTTISGFTVQDGSGIAIINSAHNIIRNNRLENNGNAIRIESTHGKLGEEVSLSNHNAIMGNQITCSYTDGGVWLHRATQTLVTDNILKGPCLNYGIIVISCGGSCFRNNSICDFRWPLYIEGSWDYISEWNLDIDTSNTVDGKIVRYLANQTSLTINSSTFPDTGYLMLINSENVIVENLTLSDSIWSPWGEKPIVSDIWLVNTTNSEVASVNGFSIKLVRSNNNVIHDNVNAKVSIFRSAENTISQNINMSIWLSKSYRNLIDKNIIDGNCPRAEVSYDMAGIRLYDSWGNTVSENFMKNCYCGIKLDWNSDHNIITGNTITNNCIGLGTYDVFSAFPENNTIYHNNLIGNEDQVSIPTGMLGNHWDNGTVGNYWSDYIGIDGDGDGIGEIPYVIDKNNQDNYPLTNRSYLLVPYEAQGSSPWCWAASTAMILRYYDKPVHVWDVGKTELVNLWLRQIESYIHKTYPGEFEIQIGSYSSISEQTREDIEGNLSKGYPVLLNVNPPGLTTHDVVVTGFNSSGFFINDPSGALFKGFESSATYPYIHEFVMWDQLQPLICKELLSSDVFLVIKGTPSPIDATLFLTNGEVGIRTIHDSDSGKGACIDYGTVGWDLYWRRIGWHPLSWDSKDSLRYYYQIFNHKDQEVRFDFQLQIEGEDQVVYYGKNISDIPVSAFDFRLVWEQTEIPLEDYLIAGQKYMVTAKVNYHGSPEIIDSVTLPSIYYGVKSIMFATECPVRMLVTDPDGLRVGFDPISNLTANEIPDALYYYGNGSEGEVISIPNQKDGNYTVTVFGIENGTYNLTCTSLNETGFLSTESFTNIPIEESDSQIYIIPAFPSSLILPIFMIATLLAVIVYRRKRQCE